MCCHLPLSCIVFVGIYEMFIFVKLKVSLSQKLANVFLVSIYKDVTRVLEKT